MDSNKPELTLEDVLLMANGVKRWKRSKPFDLQTRYEGYFRPRGGFSRVKLSLTLEAYSGGPYYGEFKYKGHEYKIPCGIVEAYRIAKDAYNRKHPGDLKRNQQAAEEKQSTLEELKGGLQSSYSRLPLRRRIGR